MKKTIAPLAEKYNFSTIQERLLSLTNEPTIRIGFIGEFSAGKSSLINSILGIHLPTNISPTTKAICLVEPTVGLEQNVYLKEEGNQRASIEFEEFCDILRGEIKGTAAIVKVPPCDVLPAGCVFVDTPGIHTAVGDEAELTYAYLCLLDAAVVCINITDGIISKSLLDFICSTKLKHLQKHLVFAITWSDRKSPDEGKSVKNSIIELLKKTVAGGKLQIDNIEKKVFTISSMEEGNAEKLYEVLQNAVLADLPALHEQRKQFMLKSIGNELLALLLERLKISSYDSSEIDHKLQEVQNNIKSLMSERHKREDRLADFGDGLQGKIKAALNSHMYTISNAKDAPERSSAIGAMIAEISEMLKSEAQRYLGIAGFGNGDLGSIGLEIEQKIKSIEAFKDLSVTIGTAALTAWILPGASLALNTGEAAAGAAAKGAATAASTAAKGAAAAAKVGTFTKILGGIGTALKDINPLEHIGTLVSSYAKKNALENLVNEKSASISNAMICSLEEPYQNEVLQPLQDKLAEEKRQLTELFEQGDKAFQAFKAGKDTLCSEIAELQNALVH